MRAALTMALGAAVLLASAPASAAGAEAAWTLAVPADQPIRMRRSFQEKTADASARGPVQTVQGAGNPAVQLLVLGLAQVLAGKLERDAKAGDVELVVPTDTALAPGAVAMSDAGTQKTYQTQDDANQVIRPYALALSGMGLHELLVPALPSLQDRGLRVQRSAGAEGMLRMASQFVFSSDQRSISVELAIGPVPAEGADASATPRQPLRVRVHSEVADAFDISDHWLRDDARALRGQLRDVLVRALELALPRLRGTPAPADAVQRTHRFRLGADSVYVRGVLARIDCRDVQVDALEGHLVSLPTSAMRGPAAMPPDCPRP